MFPSSLWFLTCFRFLLESVFVLIFSVLLVSYLGMLWGGLRWVGTVILVRPKSRPTVQDCLMYQRKMQKESSHVLLSALPAPSHQSRSSLLGSREEGLPAAPDQLFLECSSGSGNSPRRPPSCGCHSTRTASPQAPQDKMQSLSPHPLSSSFLYLESLGLAWQESGRRGAGGRTGSKWMMLPSEACRL